MITRKLALTLAFLGAAGLAHADYNQAMRHFEQQDYQQALREFSDAAQSGDPYAQYMLGRLYEAGNGTPQDFVEAHKWYNLAAARGHRHAAEARDALAKRMTPAQIARAQQAASNWQPEESSSSPATSRSDIDGLSERERVAGIQHELNRLGYDAGPTDGVMGSRTRNAIIQYQADMGIPRDGVASIDLLKRLRQTEADTDRQAGAWSRVILRENFGDGDYRHNPSWTVLSGDFEVDRNGLRSIVATQPATRDFSSDRPEDIGLAVLGMILEQRSDGRQDQTSAPMEPARIFVNAPVDNAFRMKVDLASRESPGRLALGVFQGNQPDGTGYRLVYSAGARPGLSLVRLISGNAEIVARHDGVLDLEDGQFHHIVWSRDGSGRMQVRLDGRDVLSAQDHGLRDPFQGVVLTNDGGDYSLRRIRLEE